MLMLNVTVIVKSYLKILERLGLPNTHRLADIQINRTAVKLFSPNFLNTPSN